MSNKSILLFLYANLIEMKKHLTKERLVEAAKNGDNKSLVLLLRSFETGIEAMDETEDPAWLIENKPAIDARDEEREYYRQIFVDRMKDIDNDTLMTYWMFFVGSSFNAYFILEELAKRGDREAFQWLARAYGDGDAHSGIYRNKTKSRSYFDKAIALGHPFAKENLRLMEGRWRDELKYAREFEFHVLGPNDDLDKLYCCLSHSFSRHALANDDIPLEDLFNELVGGGEYAGVIHSVDKINDVVIIRIYTEGNTNRFAVAFAIQQAFSSLRVDWDHLRKQ